MHSDPFLLRLLALALAAPFLSHARTWTSADGRTIEADFVRASDTAVTVKRSDGATVDIPLERLSEADRTWVAEQNKPKPIEGPFAKLVTGDWALAEHGDLPYALFASKDLDAGRKYPLVISLHGKSDNNENGKQIGLARTFASPANYAERPCFILAPLCYQPYGATGGGWSDKPGDEVLELIEKLVEALPVDTGRIYVVGYSMGGFGVCHLMNQEPKLFAAGVPVAGYGHSFDELKRKPIWLFHAADDPVVEVGGSRRMAEELKRSKVFKYTEFPDGGHSISGRVFDDPEVHKWLFEQRNG